MTATALIGAGVSAYSAYDASQKKKQAQKALENLPTPETSNVAENLQVSTRGADLRTAESGRVSASAIDALRGSGARGVIGGVGAVQAQNAMVNESVGANLDEQQRDIDRLRASDKARIQGINENRYQSDVNALSSQYNSAQDAQNQGIVNTLNFATAARGGLKTKNDEEKAQVEQGKKYKKIFSASQKFDNSTGFKPKY